LTSCMNGTFLGALIGLGLLSVGATRPAEESVPENVYKGEMAAFPGPWAFQIHRSGIILVTDGELEALADPDKAINLSLDHTPNERSLRQICEAAKAAGQRTLIIAFDHFFAQYRPGQGDKPRRLTPDMPEYIERIGAVSKFAAGYGLGLELSLLSPLEVGPAYAKETGESGLWMHYRKGLRDPVNGDYSVQLWRQRKWANNKGPLDVQDAGVRVFAFRENIMHGTSYHHVDPKGIVDISETAQVEVWKDAISRPAGAVRIRIHGKGGPPAAAGLDHVLVVQQYKTPEMDYFSDKALPYLNKLTDRYVDAGVKLNGLYADEMHIQQDWGYHTHHDNGEFAVRYVSPGFARRFAAAYGQEYTDFAKYLIYFTYGQEDTVNDMTAKDHVMHVMSPTPEGVRLTALMRARYYHMIQDGVVDLFTAAKRHLERRVGYRLEARAHATWAESPTCDRWRSSQGYEYTADYIGSTMVHQASAACYDYFKWGDFLTGNGNDHAEGGFLDRDYFAMALACSTGILNDVPNSYAAGWGMPAEIGQRHNALTSAYGDAAPPFFGMVQGMVHRDVDVLMLYPIDLVATEERFGNWMTQYGYANCVTPAKLLERGTVRNGAIEMAGRRFTTLVTLFEPFPSPKLLEMMRQMADGGGRVIWSGPPPVVAQDGSPALAGWKDMFGVDYPPTSDEGLMVPGKQVVFEGKLAGLAPMTVLTEMLPDRVYSIACRPGTQPVARVKKWMVGAHKTLDKGGSLTFLGFRPRDDQSGSLGYDARWWFDILNTLGSYPASGRFAGVNDNTEVLSRTGEYLICRFPNGAVAVAPHLRSVEESWPGGWARNREEDEKIIKNLALPPRHVSLKDARINGQTVSFEGEQSVAFRADDKGRLIAFCGFGCNQVTVNGKTTVFAEAPMPLVAWAPIEPECRTPAGAVMRLRVHGAGTVRIPAAGLGVSPRVFAEGPTLGSRGAAVECRVEADALVVALKPEQTNRWFYVVAGPAIQK
jgi:hypothetical protein